jgi:DNA polymerase-3 subunit delta
MIPNVFFFTGENHTELLEKLNFWKQEFVKKHSDSNLEVFESVTEKSLSDMVNALESAPFLAEKRMVLIKGFPFAADVKKKVETEALEEVLQNLPDTTLVIFASPTPDKRSRFFKWLQKNAKVEEFTMPRGREMLAWVQKKFQRHQRSISPRAAEVLLFYCGEDLNTISHEVEKLSLLGVESIDEKMIERYVTPNPEAKLFKVLDLVGKVSPKELLFEFSELIKSGEDLMMVFYMIVRQVRLLTQIRSLKDTGMPREVIQKKMRLAPFQVGALAKQAESLSLAVLRRSYRHLTTIELDIKTGKIPVTADNNQLLHLRLDQFLCSLYE